MPGLTDFQCQVVATALEAAADGFALAGTAALLVHGLTDRTTADLELVSPSDDVSPAAARVVDALEESGFTVVNARRRPSPIYVPLVVTLEDDNDEDVLEDVRVELGRDRIVKPLVDSTLGPVLDAEELAANSVISLFGRIEPRDLDDVARLAPLFGWEAMFALAEKKDDNFDPVAMADTIDLVVQYPISRFPAECDPVALCKFGRSLSMALKSGGALPEKTPYSTKKSAKANGKS